MDAVERKRRGAAIWKDRFSPQDQTQAQVNPL